jgi:hypothetical protein
MKNEIFKDTVYEGYQVSNFGNVKSVKFGKERILKPGISGRDYYNVTLSINGKTKTFDIHQLVAIAFLGHTPNKGIVEVDHIDGNKFNNSVSNLQILSKEQHTRKDLFGKGVGTTWDKHANKWISKIKINHKTIHLGLFINKQDAINLYNKAINNIHLYNGDNKEFRNKLKYDL